MKATTDSYGMTASESAATVARIEAGALGAGLGFAGAILIAPVWRKGVARWRAERARKWWRRL